MTELETLYGASGMTFGNVVPEDIARLVTSHIVNFEQDAHGFPSTSPFGLRAMMGLKRKHQDILFDQEPDVIHEFVDRELRENGNDIDTAVHVTWRHANRLYRFATSDELTPLERDFVTFDSPLIKWSLIEPAFRMSAGMLLSRATTIIPVQGEYLPIEQPKFDEAGKIVSSVQKYGQIVASNCVRYDVSGENLATSSYRFEKIAG